MSSLDLPDRPRTVQDSEARLLERSLWLRGLLGDVSARPEVDALGARMKEVFFPKGSYLYRAGTASDQVAFIVSGTIVQGSEGLTRFGTGDVLGFVDTTIGRPHAKDALVESDAVVLLLDFDDWLEFLEDNFDFMRSALLRRTHELPPTSLAAHLDAIDFASVRPESAVGRLVERVAALHFCPLLQRASIQAVAQLARYAESYDLRFGERITIDASLTGIWVGLEGEFWVEVDQGQNRVSYRGGRATLLGGLTVLQNVLSTVTIEARSEARLLHVGTERFFDVMEDHFDVARSVLAYVAVQVEEYNRSAARAAPATPLPSGG